MERYNAGIQPQTILPALARRECCIKRNADDIMTTPIADRETILRMIETWPAEDQIALAQLILRRAAEHAQPQRPSWREMVGLAATGQPPPSDEDISTWLDEHRSEKYG
jgi:hypothetical protein